MGILSIYNVVHHLCTGIFILIDGLLVNINQRSDYLSMQPDNGILLYVITYIVCTFL